jgi:hypothetical protein
MLPERQRKFHASLEVHQIKGKGIIGFGLPVTLHGSENEYIRYPSQGVLVINEQGVDLSVINAVFHCSNEDGSLGAPCRVKRPIFTYAPEGRA